jgi:hypothetical protein
MHHYQFHVRLRVRKFLYRVVIVNKEEDCDFFTTQPDQ